MRLEDLLHLPAALTIYDVMLAPPGVVLRARLATASAACPICRQTSTSVHSRYVRRAAEVPIAGVAVRVWFTVRRFICRNTTCSRRTFTKQIPEWLAPHAQRSQRLRALQQQLGLALGGELGHRLTGPLAVPVSADTVLRLIRQAQVLDRLQRQAPAIGIKDILVGGDNKVIRYLYHQSLAMEMRRAVPPRSVSVLNDAIADRVGLRDRRGLVQIMSEFALI